MCFNQGFSENCIYVQGSMHDKECVDTFAFGNSEIAYECMDGGLSYKTFWCIHIIKCTECYFLTDCEDSMNCFMSTGLRHKQYIFRNEQLSKNDYEERIGRIDFGNHQVIHELKKEFGKLEQRRLKPAIDGARNEHVSGNYLYACRNTYDSYMMEEAENCANCYYLVNKVKDCLDVCTFGYGIEKGYRSMGLGHNDYNVRYSVATIENSINCEYCIECRNCSDCFGCTGLSKKQFCILNKQYSKEDYDQLRKKLIEYMSETGEYGKFFPQRMCPFGYNEAQSQLALPLTQEEAKKRGFKWYEKPIPPYATSDVYTPADNIKDISWKDIHGKIIVCVESGRPFKIIKQEFDFYKKYCIPLPRLHPDVRLANRYPTGELYNMHDAQCMQCGITVQNSMRTDERVLCKQCYQRAIY